MAVETLLLHPRPSSYFRVIDLIGEMMPHQLLSPVIFVYLSFLGVLFGRNSVFQQDLNSVFHRLQLQG